jgi:hypothetical protein
MSGCSSYTSANMRRTLFASAAERSHVFGYDKQNNGRVQQNYNDNWKYNHLASPSSKDISQAGREYYFNTSVDPSKKAILGYLGMNPTIYDDNLQAGLNTVVQDRYKNWQPFTSTANPIPSGGRVQFIPHESTEIAPRQMESYWQADLNSRMYERGLISSAIESPYSNWYGRQALLNLVSQNMRSSSDPYLKQINSPDETFANQVRSGNLPSVTNF